MKLTSNEFLRAVARLVAMYADSICFRFVEFTVIKSVIQFFMRKAPAGTRVLGITIFVVLFLL